MEYRKMMLNRMKKAKNALKVETNYLKNLPGDKKNKNVTINTITNPAVGMIAEKRVGDLLNNDASNMNSRLDDIEEKLNSARRNASNAIGNMVNSIPKLETTQCYTNMAGNIPCSKYVKEYSQKIVNDYHNSLVTGGTNNLFTKEIIGGK